MNDYKTPEFWITALTEIVIAVVAILVARGLLAADEGQLWIELARVLIAPIAIIIMGIVAKSYTAHMTAVRVALMENETARLMASQPPRPIRTFTGPYDVTISSASASTGGTPV